MNLDLGYYLSVFWRRSPYFLIVASILTSVGLTIAMVLPPEYEARATLLVESAQIPESLASSTVETNPQEQLQIIEQRLMTRANLIDIAERLDVFERERGEPVRASEIVEKMRTRTTFEANAQRMNRRGRQGATLVTIAFRAENSQAAARVANEFVTLVLQENVEMRTNVAGETLEFFEQEVTQLSSQLDAQAAEIIEFRTAAGMATPENQDFLVNRQTTMQSRLNEIERQILLASDQKDRLRAIAEQSVANSVEEASTPQERALLSARNELDAALLVYAESSPRVRLLRGRIAQLERQVASEQLVQVDQAEAPDTSAADLLLETQLSEIDRQVELLETEAAQIRESLEETDDLLVQIPANGLTLRALEREHGNIQGQYNQAVSRLSAAETGERIELLSKGQRITIIEQATPPDRPTKPDRVLIAGAGAGAGIALGMVVVLLLELFNRAIRRPSEIVNGLGITPIAVLPYIRTDSEVAWRRVVLILILCSMVLVVPLTIYAVHSFVIPLDNYVDQVLGRFGFALPAGF